MKLIFNFFSFFIYTLRVNKQFSRMKTLCKEFPEVVRHAIFAMYANTTRLTLCFQEIIPPSTNFVRMSSSVLAFLGTCLCSYIWIISKFVTGHAGWAIYPASNVTRCKQPWFCGRSDLLVLWRFRKDLGRAFQIAVLSNFQNLLASLSFVAAILNLTTINLSAGIKLLLISWRWMHLFTNSKEVAQGNSLISSLQTSQIDVYCIAACRPGKKNLYDTVNGWLS